MSDLQHAPERAPRTGYNRTRTARTLGVRLAAASLLGSGAALMAAQANVVHAADSTTTSNTSSSASTGTAGSSSSTSSHSSATAGVGGVTTPKTGGNDAAFEIGIGLVVAGAGVATGLTAVEKRRRKNQQ
jgi:hypothetical protein